MNPSFNNEMEYMRDYYSKLSDINNQYNQLPAISTAEDKNNAMRSFFAENFGEKAKRYYDTWMNDSNSAINTQFSTQNKDAINNLNVAGTNNPTPSNSNANSGQTLSANPYSDDIGRQEAMNMINSKANNLYVTINNQRYFVDTENSGGFWQNVRLINTNDGSVKVIGTGDLNKYECSRGPISSERTIKENVAQRNESVSTKSGGARQAGNFVEVEGDALLKDTTGTIIEESSVASNYSTRDELYNYLRSRGMTETEANNYIDDKIQSGELEFVDQSKPVVHYNTRGEAISNLMASGMTEADANKYIDQEMSVGLMQIDDPTKVEKLSQYRTREEAVAALTSSGFSEEAANKYVDREISNGHMVLDDYRPIEGEEGTVVRKASEEEPTSLESATVVEEQNIETDTTEEVAVEEIEGNVEGTESVVEETVSGDTSEEQTEAASGSISGGGTFSPTDSNNNTKFKILHRNENDDYYDAVYTDENGVEKSVMVKKDEKGNYTLIDYSTGQTVDNVDINSVRTLDTHLNGVDSRDRHDAYDPNAKNNYVDIATEDFVSADGQTEVKAGEQIMWSQNITQTADAAERYTPGQVRNLSTDSKFQSIIKSNSKDNVFGDISGRKEYSQNEYIAAMAATGQYSAKDLDLTAQALAGELDGYNDKLVEFAKSSSQFFYGTEFETLYEEIKDEDWSQKADYYEDLVSTLREEFDRLHDSITGWTGSASRADKKNLNTILGKFEVTMGNIEKALIPSCDAMRPFIDDLLELRELEKTYIEFHGTLLPSGTESLCTAVKPIARCYNVVKDEYEKSESQRGKITMYEKDDEGNIIEENGKKKTTTAYDQWYKRNKELKEEFETKSEIDKKKS